MLPETVCPRNRLDVLAGDPGRLDDRDLRGRGQGDHAVPAARTCPMNTRTLGWF